MINGSFTGRLQLSFKIRVYGNRLTFWFSFFKVIMSMVMLWVSDHLDCYILQVSIYWFVCAANNYLCSSSQTECKTLIVLIHNYQCFPCKLVICITIPVHLYLSDFQFCFFSKYLWITQGIEFLFQLEFYFARFSISSSSLIHPVSFIFHSEVYFIWFSFFNSSFIHQFFLVQFWDLSRLFFW